MDLIFGLRKILPPAFRKRVVLHEFWGTLLDNRGRVIAERQVATMANDRYLIRPPEDNPFWHGQSPFVCAPLVRVPFSVRWNRDARSATIEIQDTTVHLKEGDTVIQRGTSHAWSNRFDKPCRILFSQHDGSMDR